MSIISATGTMAIQTISSLEHYMSIHICEVHVNSTNQCICIYVYVLRKHVSLYANMHIRSNIFPRTNPFVCTHTHTHTPGCGDNDVLWYLPIQVLHYTEENAGAILTSPEFLTLSERMIHVISERELQMDEIDKVKAILT